MSDSKNLLTQDNLTTRVLETSIRVGLVIILLVWCYLIIQPFMVMIIWGIIIAIALYPGYNWLKKRLGERKKLAALLLTFLALIIIILPLGLLAGSLVSGVEQILDLFQNNQTLIPPPPDHVKSWPLVGEPAHGFWTKASTNLGGMITEYESQLQVVLTWLLGAISGGVLGYLKFIVSILIGGILLVYTDAGSKSAYDIAHKLLGERGKEYAENAERTVRNVARGILGVALIEALLAGLVFMIFGVPAAGLWALLMFILGIVQIGILPVAIPVIIYMFFTAGTFNAIAVLVGVVLILPLNNILKPILLGKGAPAPMVIIFMGAIGGFIVSGILGLFVGAVILSIGYNLFLLWIKNEETETNNESA
ncbi:MAG: AI-2E family transporter [Bacteroidetes bacterium]|nr:AI-2E family transporter [Bacteroidota bacterium]